MKDSTRTIRGTVLDAAGRPVAQARVQIVQAPGPVPDIAALTGADGRFELAAARPGPYEIECHTDTQGSARARVEVGTVGGRSAADGADLQLTVRR